MSKRQSLNSQDNKTITTSIKNFNVTDKIYTQKTCISLIPPKQVESCGKGLLSV